MPLYIGLAALGLMEKPSDRFKTMAEWEKCFARPMFLNCQKALKNGGVGVFIVGKGFNISCLADIPDVRITEIEVINEKGSLRRVERGIVMVKNVGIGKFKPTGVECLLCHRHFRHMGIHLKEGHGMTTAEYLEKFPNAETKPLKHGKRPKGLRYVSRHTYYLPDGSSTTNGAVWHRAWNGNPPAEACVREDCEYHKDKFADKKEGVDYVVCGICGKKKGVCLTRHIKEHGWTIEHYREVYGAETCAAGMERLKTGANEAWKTRKLHTEAE